MPMGVHGPLIRIKVDMRTAPHEYCYQLCISAELVIQPSINESINMIFDLRLINKEYTLRYIFQVFCRLFFLFNPIFQTMLS